MVRLECTCGITSSLGKGLGGFGITSNHGWSYYEGRRRQE